VPDRTAAYLPDLTAFAFTLALAWYLDWEAADLVWGLWLSSLLVGYLVMLSQIVHLPVKAMHGALTGNERFPWRQVVPGLAAIVAFFAFLLAFFTLHFGAFHFGHGFLLEGFFPIDGMSYPDGALAFASFVGVLFVRYYGMVVASAVVQRRLILEPEGMKHVMQPYKSVLKMHLMIFLFAGLHAAGATNFAFYAVTLVVYFFPWRALKAGDVDMPAAAETH
jgi:hypothetical protein